MPYIKPEDRPQYNVIIDGLAHRLRIGGGGDRAIRGHVNYVITEIVLCALKPGGGWGYHSLSDCVSVLKDAAAEIERRLLAPYEDRKIQENGDCSGFCDPLTATAECCSKTGCKCDEIVVDLIQDREATLTELAAMLKEEMKKGRKSE